MTRETFDLLIMLQTSKSTSVNLLGRENYLSYFSIFVEDGLTLQENTQLATDIAVADPLPNIISDDVEMATKIYSEG
jgi:hypothetical protein